MSPEERDRLIDALLDQEISEADFLRLEAEMHVDESARRAYYERIKLDTGLDAEAQARLGDGGNEDEQVLRTGGVRKGGEGLGWLGWAAAAVLGVLAIVLGMEVRQGNGNGAGGEQAEPVASGFGVVGRQFNTDWNLERGDLLPTEEIGLSSGMAELEFFSGATLVVEGPARFEVMSSSRIRAVTGRFFVRVPPLVNVFRIETAGGEIFKVDGEDLVLSVPESGKAVVETGGGEVESTLENERVSKRREWEAFAERMAEDPRLLLYFPMRDLENSGRRLPDQARGKQDGTIIRATRATDRWGQPYRGLDFTPTGSRVRVEVPGDHESLTLMCWVKIDSLDRWYNSLFLTDGHELHEPHWQIMNDGRLFFSVKANEPARKGKDKHIAFSPPIWSALESGRWLHIATVFDGKAMTTTHFLNGEMISRDEIPESLKPEKVQIGAASIGNWSDPTRGDDPHFAVRNLNGTMDEFALFSAPLTAEEIREIYEAGKP